jgi:hypothetical protein
VTVCAVARVSPWRRPPPTHTFSDFSAKLAAIRQGSGAKAMAIVTACLRTFLFRRRLAAAVERRRDAHRRRKQSAWTRAQELTGGPPQWAFGVFLRMLRPEAATQAALAEQAARAAALRRLRLQSGMGALGGGGSTGGRGAAFAVPHSDGPRRRWSVLAAPLDDDDAEAGAGDADNQGGGGGPGAPAAGPRGAVPTAVAAAAAAAAGGSGSGGGGDAGGSDSGADGQDRAATVVVGMVKFALGTLAYAGIEGEAVDPAGVALHGLRDVHTVRRHALLLHHFTSLWEAFSREWAVHARQAAAGPGAAPASAGTTLDMGVVAGAAEAGAVSVVPRRRESLWAQRVNSALSPTAYSGPGDLTGNGGIAPRGASGSAAANGGRRGAARAGQGRAARPSRVDVHILPPPDTRPEWGQGDEGGELTAPAPAPRFRPRSLARAFRRRARAVTAHLSRALMSQQEWERRQREVAAVQIQALVRGGLARRRFRELKRIMRHLARAKEWLRSVLY